MSAFTVPWKVSYSDSDTDYPLTSESLSSVGLANLRAGQRPEWQKWLVKKEMHQDGLQETWVMHELHSRNSSAGPAAAFQKINSLDLTSQHWRCSRGVQYRPSKRCYICSCFERMVRWMCRGYGEALWRSVLPGHIHEGSQQTGHVIQKLPFC